MRAIVVGATGAVGRDLVEALCADPRYTEVRTFTRRELGVDDPKLRPYVVDFERTEGWHDLVQGDVIFSALGTSKKQAGSKEAQYRPSRSRTASATWCSSRQLVPIQALRSST